MHSDVARSLDAAERWSVALGELPRPAVPPRDVVDAAAARVAGWLARRGIAPSAAPPPADGVIERCRAAAAPAALRAVRENATVAPLGAQHVRALASADAHGGVGIEVATARACMLAALVDGGEDDDVGQLRADVARIDGMRGDLARRLLPQRQQRRRLDDAAELRAVVHARYVCSRPSCAASR